MHAIAIYIASVFIVTAAQCLFCFSPIKKKSFFATICTGQEIQYLLYVFFIYIFKKHHIYISFVSAHTERFSVTRIQNFLINLRKTSKNGLNFLERMDFVISKSFFPSPSVNSEHCSQRGWVAIRAGIRALRAKTSNLAFSPIL